MARKLLFTFRTNVILVQFPEARSANLRRVAAPAQLLETDVPATRTVLERGRFGLIVAQRVRAEREAELDGKRQNRPVLRSPVGFPHPDSESGLILAGRHPENPGTLR